MQECCYYSSLIRLSPLTASATALNKTGIYPILPEIKLEYGQDWTKSIYKVKYPLDENWIREKFEHPPQGVGRKTTLTIMTIDNLKEKGLDETDLRIMGMNIGWMEFAVAGWMLWRMIVPQNVKTWAEENDVFMIPLKDLKNKIGGFLDDVRRCAAVNSKYTKEENIEIAGHLRKLTNISGRDLLPADFEQEKERTNPKYAVRMYPERSRKTMSIKKWWEKTKWTMQELIHEIINQMIEQGNLRTITNWWKQRIAWTPGGSSSKRHNLDVYKESDKRIQKEDRPNKKTVSETLDINDLRDWVYSKPRGIARVSTKPEPGFKRRALYAQDDESTYIASYASVDFEKCMNIGGMVAKQTPKDVIEWMNATKKGHNNDSRIWVSLDYSDFNKEHSKLLLMLLNVIICQEWLKRRHERSQDIIISKAICSLWTAKSHINAWTRYPGEDFVKDYSGLWSGHRDTARDNTLLHLVYSRMVRKAVLECTGKKCNIEYMGICGDDEDALHNSEEEAALYMGAHVIMGYHLNPAKQLIDYSTHEFLQRYATEKTMPIRPLAPTIATMSTGSWYKISYTYYDTVIDSMNENFQEMVNRGGHKLTLQKLACIMIDRIMQIEKDGIKMKLQWWPFRHGYKAQNSEEHIFWKGSGMGRKPPVFPKSKIYPKKNAPKKAVNEWCEANDKWVNLLKDKRKTYEKELLRESYKNFFGKEAEKHREMEAMKQFPIRKEEKEWKKFLEKESKKPEIPKIEEHNINKSNIKEIRKEIDKNYGMRRPTTLETILAKMQLDPLLFNMIGGWETIVKHGGPKSLMYYEHIDTRIREKKTWEDQVDTAISSWIKNRWNE
mmetsp:Transcript_33335/g.96302  ORF Transcript_33335/g.96302 Transcript_33335/m.96302 type:complete len:836 (-) Transcript_33335:67-2574(-)